MLVYVMSLPRLPVARLTMQLPELPDNVPIFCVRPQGAAGRNSQSLSAVSLSCRVEQII